MSTMDRTSLRRRLASGQARILGAVVAAGLAASLLSGGPAAQADNLDDQQAALEAESARVQASLEFVDAKIAKAAGDLQRRRDRTWEFIFYTTANALRLFVSLTVNAAGGGTWG